MTTMTQEQILALANEVAEVDDDMNEVQAGGFEERRLPVGWSVARFTSYIEKGNHIELFQGKAKDPALAFTLGFELFSPNYLNADGTPYFIETFDISKSRNEKARAFKLFKAMNYKGLAKVFPQLLNGVFLVEIKDHLSKNAAPGTAPRSVIGEIRAGIDVVSGQEYQCGPASKLFLFSWAKPTLEGWDSFYIEGTNEKTGKSKNWKQEKIAGATDFHGSALESLLLQNGRPIPKGTPQKTGAAPAGAQPAGAVPATPAGAAPLAQPAAAPAPASAPVTAAPPAVAPVVPSAPAVAATPVAAVAVVAAPVVAAVAPVVAAPAVAVAPVVAAPVVPNVGNA